MESTNTKRYTLLQKGYTRPDGTCFARGDTFIPTDEELGLLAKRLHPYDEPEPEAPEGEAPTVPEPESAATDTAHDDDGAEPDAEMII